MPERIQIRIEDPIIAESMARAEKPATETAISLKKRSDEIRGSVHPDVTVAIEKARIVALRDAEEKAANNSQGLYEYRHITDPSA